MFAIVEEEVLLFFQMIFFVEEIDQVFNCFVNLWHVS